METGRAEELLKRCTEENKLQISLRRHIHRVDNYVVKIDLSAAESDFYGHLNDPRITRLLSENAKEATALVSKYTSIPAPSFVRDGMYRGVDGISRYYSIWDYIDGVSLEDVWGSLSVGKKRELLSQLRSFIVQLRNIPNPYPQRFAVGTLCSTGELLNDPGNPADEGSFWRNNGPFSSLDLYRKKVKVLYRYDPDFPPQCRPVFDHMDWFTCNVLVDSTVNQIVGVLDWEKAGFIPDPRDNFLRGTTLEARKRNEWLALFDD
jgi:aminoglycoside phosphotransferase (APT) family kinase protein